MGEKPAPWLGENSAEYDWYRPDDWPYTPPLDAFIEAYPKDDNLPWWMGTGHLKNLLDQALDRLEEVDQ